MTTKREVRRHWEQEVCGSRYGSLAEIETRRYRTHPFLERWADFESSSGQRVLEIGLGTGADFSRWVAAGASAVGIDLTTASLDTSRQRLAGNLGEARLAQADCENLPFQADSFDLVYSFGVLHHTPDTARAVREAYRVLRPGGHLKAMVYHLPSWVGWLLAARYLKRPRRAIYDHLESPGTKAYRRAEALELLTGIGFSQVTAEVRLSPGDVMDIEASPKHRGALFSIVRSVYPSRLIRRFGERFGLDLLLTARKA